MRLTIEQRRRRQQLRREVKAPEGGFYLLDPQTKGEVFVPFEEIHEACRVLMQMPEEFTANELGKMNYRDDPTYNLRRKR